MPTYQIKNINTGAIRLVEAPVPSAAIRHVATSDYEVTKPSAADAARLVMQGTLLEVAEGPAPRQQQSAHPGQQPLPTPDPNAPVPVGFDPGE